MVACVHHIPGRARFKIDALRRDPALARLIEEQVGALHGVHAVEINRHAASIIVHYCAKNGSLGAIMEHIYAHCPNAPDCRPAQRAMRASVARKVGEAAATDWRPKFSRALGEAASKAVINTLIKGTIERGLTSVLAGIR